MVATVGSISIDLSTNTVKFANGFKSAATTVERQSARMSKAVKGIGGIMQGFVGGIAGGVVSQLFSVSGAIDAYTKSLSRLSDVGNRAKAAGLGTDFFQGLSHGAAQAGTDTESLSAGLETFAKNVGKAREGTGQLFFGLLKLNPELLKAVLTAGDQEQRLKLVADAMSRTSDATQKAALAAAAFGENGDKMIDVLDGGRASLDEFTATARKLGVIVTEDDIKRADSLKKELVAITEIVGIRLSKELVKMGPLISQGLIKGAEALASFMQEIEQFTNSEFYKFLQKSPTQIVSEVMENFKDAEETSAEAIERLNAEIREQTELLDKLATHANDPVMALRFEREREALVKMNKELVDTIRLSRGATEEQMALFQAFRAGEAASRDMFGGGGGAGGGGNLPRVWHGTDLQGAGIDEDVMNKIEDAIHEETGATKDVRRQVERLDSNIGGYIGNLSSAQSFSFANLNDAIAALGHRVVEAAKINVDPNFRFSGLGGSDPGRSGDSWAGRRYSYKVYPLNIPLDTMGTPAAMQQPIAEAGEAAGTVNVSIMVKPVMEGTRLSAQSAAEIKQAASAGTEAALRAYHGR